MVQQDKNNRETRGPVIPALGKGGDVSPTGGSTLNGQGAWVGAKKKF